MFSKTAALSLLLAYAEARFGQEQIPVAAIQALTAFGAPGAAGTLSGQVPGVLLAGANACAKLQLADDIVAQLGNDAQVIAAAQALVAAEKNTNPFAVAIPSICSDVALPVTVELRGIIPLIDPDTLGSDVQNANSAQSLQTPFDADGLSVADISIAQGFSNFTLQGSDGSTAAADAGAAVNVGADAGADAGNNAVVECGSAAAPANNEEDAAEEDAADEDAAEANVGAAGDGITTSSIAGLDFGLCIPTMDFIAGRPGRDADQFTFLPTDTLVAEGQQDALNPGIIINRICDQLTNVCDANDAAKAACEDIQADIAADGNPQEAATAQRFNAALGFENAAFQ